MTNTRDDDGDDHGLLPAGPLRLAIGLAAMPAGVFLAALNDAPWAKWLGLALFVGSIPILLRSPPAAPN